MATMRPLLAFLICLLFIQTSFSQEFTRSELDLDLAQPWEMTYGPDDFLWITQANGIVTRVNPETGNSTNVFVASDYFGGALSEASPHCTNPKIGFGTLGLTLHPDFLNPENAFIYYFYSYNSGTEIEPATKFKIKRLKWNAGTETIIDSTDLIENIPTSYDHLGGRLLAVEQDNRTFLYLSIGDHGLSEENSPTCYPDQTENPNNWAQDPTTMNGKVHRFNIDGSIPYDNPIAGNSFFTRGHRNPQGLMYDSSTDRIFVIEHGDRTDDEINVLSAGKNYGWKHVRGYHDGNHPNELSFIENYVPYPTIENDALIEAFYSWCTSPVTDNPDNSNWCTVAPSDGIYYCNYAIPQWNNSLLVVTLKDGEGTDKEVYQFKLQVNGELMPSTDENPNPKRFFGDDQVLNGRLKDIAISPDGTKIYLLNSGGAPTSKVIVYTLDPNSVTTFQASEENCLNVFPNPASHNIRLEGINLLEDVEAIKIFGANGQLIQIVPIDCYAIDISNLAEGTYTINVYYKDGICSSKFIKS
ncbi:MAG: glucose/arabinose dehydrogenase [Crocinitomix sp.]|jgi:glucose/arabinose dehydrogenase